jgi:hypothetical protein
MQIPFHDTIGFTLLISFVIIAAAYVYDQYFRK